MVDITNARHDTIQLLARQIAKRDGVDSDRMDQVKRLGLMIFASHMMAEIESKMRATNQELGVYLKAFWELPA